MYHLIGLGNALVDIEMMISEEIFASLEVTKNSMTLIPLETRDRVLSQLKGIPQSIFSGGAVCNTLCGLAPKGHRVGMIGFVGDDAYGKKYLKDLKNLGIDFLGKITPKATGTSLVLVTPDGNRTMLTTLGCASDLDPSTLEEITLKEPNWISHLLIESYLLLGKSNIEKIKKMAYRLKEKKVGLLLSDSDAFCVEQEPEIYEEFFQLVDLFFSNGDQAKAMEKLDRLDPIDVQIIAKKFAQRSQRPKTMVVTDGANGAYIAQEELIHIPIVPTQVVDTTGAGDAFAAGVIDGWLRGTTPEAMGRVGALMASKVISHHGARSD